MHITFLVWTRDSAHYFKIRSSIRTVYESTPWSTNWFKCVFNFVSARRKVRRRIIRIFTVSASYFCTSVPCWKWYQRGINSLSITSQVLQTVSAFFIALCLHNLWGVYFSSPLFFQNCFSKPLFIFIFILIFSVLLFSAIASFFSSISTNRVMYSYISLNCSVVTNFLDKFILSILDLRDFSKMEFEARWEMAWKVAENFRKTARPSDTCTMSRSQFFFHFVKYEPAGLTEMGRVGVRQEL